MGQLRRVESTNGVEIRGGSREVRKASKRKEEQNGQKGEENTRQLRKATQEKKSVHSETSNSDIIVQIPDTNNNVHRRLGDQSPRDKEGRGDTDRAKLPR